MRRITLPQISANENQVIIGAIFGLIAAFASAGIAIWLYPILKKHNEALALGSVGFRIIEGVLYIVGVLGLLSLLTLSQEYVKAGALNASSFQASGTTLHGNKNMGRPVGSNRFYPGWHYVLLRIFINQNSFPDGCQVGVFWELLYRLASALLSLFGQLVPFSTVSVLLNLPIGVQEMVLAVWLIVKGFNPSAIASVSTKIE